MRNIPSRPKIRLLAWHVKSFYGRYSAAILMSGLACCAELFLSHFTVARGNLFFIAVAAAGWIGGYGPALLAAAFASLADAYFYIPPVDSFMIESLGGFLELAAYTFVAALLGILAAFFSETRREAIDYASEKSLFLANVSHEIRTPMNAIIGLTELLLESEWSSEHKEYLATIKDSSRSLLTLVDDLLDFSKLDFEKLKLESVDFNLGVKVRQSVELMRPLAEAKGLFLSLKIADDIPEFVHGDSFRFCQVLLNLLGNAIKFTSRGYIGVAIQLREQKNESLLLQINVTDTGIGLSERNHKKIFNSFVQIDGKGSGGTGLGLAISKKLVQLMGGEIGVQSEPGLGSNFCFTTRLQKSSASPSSQTEDRKFPLINDLSVLVAEDSPVNQLIAVKMLEKMGCRVESASNGKEAVEKFHEQHFQCIFMDCRMPILDGFQATREIRSFEKRMHRLPTPVIALTACNDAESRQKCTLSGMDDFIAKPFTAIDLEAKLRSWCEIPAPLLDRHGKNESLPEIAFDKNVLLLLAKETFSGGSGGLIEEVVRIYLSATPARLHDLKQAMRQNDLSKIQLLSHSLRGASSVVGAIKMASLCAQMEISAEQGVSENLQYDFLSLTREFEKLKTCLLQFQASERDLHPVLNTKNEVHSPA